MTNTAQKEAMDRAGELPPERRVAERRSGSQDTTIAALNQQLAAARNEALEEAAARCIELITEHQVHSNFICAKAIRALASQPAAPVQPEVLSISWPMPRYKLEQGNSRGFMDQNPDGDWCRWLDVHPNMAEPAKPVAWGLLSIQDPELTNDEQLAAYWTRKGREVTALYAAPSQAAPPVQQTGNVPMVPADFPIISLGKGLVEVGQGNQGGVPAILFGRNGAGAVGVETESNNRTMEHGECLAAITFGNPESLDVVAEKLAELRARAWPLARAILAASGGAHAVPDGVFVKFNGPACDASGMRIEVDASGMTTARPIAAPTQAQGEGNA